MYFEQSSWRLEGTLDPDAFRHAWHRLMERHAVLRTTFAWTDLESPLQVVHHHPEALHRHRPFEQSPP